MGEPKFFQMVNQMSGQNVQLCYHCHKCTAGCPTAADMDYGPDQVIKLVQMGEEKKILSSIDIWVCAGCETCGSRCPNDIDIAPVMASLREMAYSHNIAVADPDSVKFHRLFLKEIQEIGRMHEASLLGLYKVWSIHLFDDLDTALKMILKGKIPLFPHFIKGRNEVKRMYQVVKEGKL